MRLDSIHIILKEYIEEQEKLQCRWPCDAELQSYNDYQDPPHVVNQRMLEIKRESHGRRFV